jgi:hypothetical protein
MQRMEQKLSNAEDGVNAELSQLEQKTDERRR